MGTDLFSGYGYDKVGRLVERFDDDQLSDKTKNTWIYGATGVNTGRLESETQDIGNDGSTEYMRSDVYDPVSGSPSSITTTVNNQYVTNGPIVVSYTYDDQGRVQDTTYDGVTVTNRYNSQGYKAQVSRDGTALETINERDALNNATSTSFANGLKTVRTFDPKSGNLQSIRTDEGRVQNLSYVWRTDGSLKSRSEGTNTETFAYDNLKRLTSATTTHIGVIGRTLNYSYDALGNLLSKTSTVPTDEDVTGYTYNAAKPNATINVTAGGHGLTLNYDATGNVTSIASVTTDSRTFSYNVHNLVSTIEVIDPLSQLIASEEFAYGPDNQRYFRKSTWEDDGEMVTAYTLYAGSGKIERVIASNGANVTKLRITGTVIYRKEENQYYYAYKDHLDSIHKLTDEHGDLIQTFTFDPFAGRRTPDWTGELSTSKIVALIDLAADATFRGFTGHEPLDRTGVVHMNGRIYDPVIGRFLNADPVVQMPSSSQNHNRYSYVLNNPLSLVDRSGYCVEGANLDYILFTPCLPDVLFTPSFFGRPHGTEPDGARPGEGVRLAQEAAIRDKVARKFLKAEGIGGGEGPGDSGSAQQGGLTVTVQYEVQIPAAVAKLLNDLDYDQKYSASLVFQPYPFDVGVLVRYALGRNAISDLPALYGETEFTVASMEDLFGDAYVLDVEAGKRGFSFIFDKSGRLIGFGLKEGAGANIGLFKEQLIVGCSIRLGCKE